MGSTSASYVSFVVQPNGNDLNGGAFDPDYESTGTDASQDDDPIVIVDGSSITCSIISRNTLELDGYDVQTSDIGNCFLGQMDDSATSYVQSGPITSIDTSNNRWNFGSQAWQYYTATEFTSGRLGGALATPGGLTIPGSTNCRLGAYANCYIKASTYTMTSSDLESGGRIKPTEEGFSLIAYKNAPGDHLDYPEDRAIIDTGSTSNNSDGVIYYPGTRIGYCIGLDLRGNSTWNLAYQYRLSCYNCVAKDFLNTGFSTASTASNFSCRAENCGSGSDTQKGFGEGTHVECIAIDCEPYGFCDFGSAVRCAAHGGTFGFGLGSYAHALNCIADGQSNTGFYVRSTRSRTTGSVAINCATGASARGGSGEGNAYYNNTTNISASSEDPYETSGSLQLTADPFNDAANQDYTINGDSGGGAELAERSPKWGAGVSVDGPQQQQSAQLKSSSGGSTTVVTPGPVQIGM